MPAALHDRKSLDTPTMGQILSKVPEVTIFFWIIKVLCTTVGETASDFLNVNLNFGLNGTSLVMGVVLAVVLFIQLKTKKYTPVVYWLTVVLISIFGTLVTDTLSTNAHVPLELSTIIFTVLLACTFGFWYLTEKTLSIHSIFTRRRELFYWLAILFTFALGTASGDLMAESLGLGYATTGIIIAGVIAAFAIGWRLGLNAIIAFWFIYIMTRPLGASLGDFLSQPKEYGGLGLGATMTSLIFGAAIIFTVTFLMLSRKDMVADPIAEERQDRARSTHVFWQLAIVVLVLAVSSIGGYYWRHQSLTAAPDASASGAATGSAAAPLGDLSSFKTITQDTLDLVNAGDLPGAKTRVADLEHAWDVSQARLKPMDTAKWTELDGKIDKVLRELRAISPTQQGSKAALEALLASLNAP